MESTGVYVDELLGMLREDEGLKLKPYKCPAGKKTIGYGFNMEANKLPDFIDHYLMQHGFIATEMAEYLLDKKLTEVINEVKAVLPKDVWKALTPRRREVVVMMAYNMGNGFLEGSHKWPKFCAALYSNNTEEVCREMKNSAWHSQVGERAVKLIEMYRKG
jgi:lysozyme